MGSESSSSRYCSTRECSGVPGSGISWGTLSERGKGKLSAVWGSGGLAPAGAQFAVLWFHSQAGERNTSLLQKGAQTCRLYASAMRYLIFLSLLENPIQYRS